MAKEAAEPGTVAKDEVDVVRAAIYFLGILLVGLVVVLFFLREKRDDLRDAVAWGTKSLPEMAGQYDEVRSRVKLYRDSGADEALREIRTWLQQRTRTAGIQDGQVTTEKWSVRAQRDHEEHYVPVVVKGVTLAQATHFLWNVEKVSPKMRTIDLTLRRTAPNNAPETDLWEVKASFGYRVPRGLKETQ
jgi:hypothetical protein